MGKVLVVGVGNTIMADDGLGVAALHRLRESSLPAHVDTVEAGTALLDALPDLAPYHRVILLDAVQSNGEGVAVLRDPLSADMPNRGLSLHDVGIEEALKLIRLECGALPEIVIMGLNPTRLGFDTHLSDDVAGRLPVLVDAVLKEIDRKETLEPMAAGL
jgi:hydrogenase maturation protease